MSIFVDENTKVIVQGLTGGQGRFHGLRNRDYGTQVVAGVTPGKGGTDVDGVPVYDTVAEAVAATGADASFVVVPPEVRRRRHPGGGRRGGHASSSASPRASRPRTRPCSTTSCGVITPAPGCSGPTVPGIISPGKCNIGITSGDIALPGGPVGIVSRSGTLTYQALHELSQQKVGQTTCVGIGGDPVPGTSFIDCLAAFEEDPDTRAVMMIGEIGGSAEEQAAQFIAEHMTKPVVGYIAGVTAPTGPQDGPRRRHHLRFPGHGAGQDGSALGRRGATWRQNPTEAGELMVESGEGPRLTWSERGRRAGSVTDVRLASARIGYRDHSRRASRRGPAGRRGRRRPAVPGPRDRRRSRRVRRARRPPGVRGLRRRVRPRRLHPGASSTSSDAMTSTWWPWPASAPS